MSRLEEVLEDGGDVLLLMEGTNDISRGISPETTLFNLNEMARSAADRGLSTVHATLIPRYPQAVVDPNNVLNRSMARGIRELAADTGHRLVDPFEVFLKYPQPVRELLLRERHRPGGASQPAGLRPPGHGVLQRAHRARRRAAGARPGGARAGRRRGAAARLDPPPVLRFRVRPRPRRHPSLRQRRRRELHLDR